MTDCSEPLVTPPALGVARIVGYEMLSWSLTINLPWLRQESTHHLQFVVVVKLCCALRASWLENQTLETGVSIDISSYV